MTTAPIEDENVTAVIVAQLAMRCAENDHGFISRAREIGDLAWAGRMFAPPNWRESFANIARTVHVTGIAEPWYEISPNDNGTVINTVEALGQRFPVLAVDEALVRFIYATLVPLADMLVQLTTPNAQGYLDEAWLGKNVAETIIIVAEAEAHPKLAEIRDLCQRVVYDVRDHQRNLGAGQGRHLASYIHDNARAIRALFNDPPTAS